MIRFFGVLVLLFSVLFLHSQEDVLVIKESAISYDQVNAVKSIKNAIWSVDFEEESPSWTFGHQQYPWDWEVNDTTPDYGYSNYDYPDGVSPLWLYMGYVKYFSESGNNFAYIDGVSHGLDLINPSHDSVNAWIQFDDIDLSAIDNPQLHFYQVYRKFNSDSCFIDFSVDDGLSWETFNINNNVIGNELGDQLMALDIGSFVANESNVSLRFRWKGQPLNGYIESGYGYGWQIDDIKIIDPPIADLALNNPIINFFDYVDYHQAGNEEYFHKSSHYTKIPHSQLCDNDASLSFHAEVCSYGSDPVIPEFKIQILNPEMQIIHEETANGPEILINQCKQVDIVSSFVFPETSESGIYTITYSANTPLDDNQENNQDTILIEITEDVYARDNNNFQSPPSDHSTTTRRMYGTDYYFTETSYINKIRVFVLEHEGTFAKLRVRILKYNNATDTFENLYISEIKSIEEYDLPCWVTYDLAEPIEIVSGQDAIPIRVALEFPQWGSDVLVGEDHTVPASDWGIRWMEIEEDGSVVADDYHDQYYARSVGLGLRLHLTENPNPIYDTVVCGSSVVLDAPVGYDEYLWNTGETSQSISVDENGEYFYTAISNDETVTDTINVQLLPVFEHWDTHISLCENDSVFWQGQIISEPGNYTATYESVYGCDSLYYVTASQMESPSEYNITRIPSDGILNPGETGELLIDGTDSGVIYYVDRGCLVEGSASAMGTGEALSFGADFPPGYYYIYSTNGICNTEHKLVSNEPIVFTYSTGAPKIVAAISYAPGFNFFGGHNANQKLFRQNSSDYENVTLVAHGNVNGNGLTEFHNLETGDYLLKSSVDSMGYFESNNYENTVESLFYNNALIFEEAESIPINYNQIRIVKVHHPLLYPNTGSNTIYGIVQEELGDDNFNGIENESVVLYNPINDAIIGVTSTGPSGGYQFENVPEHSNLEVFVTSLDFQNWTSAEVETQVNEQYRIDFLANEDQVFPAGIKPPMSYNKPLDFDIYPNPASTTIYINNISSDATYNIFDMKGRLVEKNDLIDKQVNVRHIKSGIYYLIVRTEHEIGIKRFSIIN